MSTTGVDRLIGFVRREFSRRELIGFVEGISRAKRSVVRIPDDYRALPAAEAFLREKLDDPTAGRYLAALKERKRRGAPLVRSDLLPRRPPPQPQARNADEFQRMQSESASRSFWRAHEANRGTPHYDKLRKQRLKRAKNRCEKCGSTKRLQLHHLDYETLKQETLSDVVILCSTCHLEATNRQRATRRARWRGGPSTRGPKLYG